MHMIDRLRRLKTKKYGDTPDHSQSPCTSCTYFNKVVGDKLNDSFSYCSKYETRLHFTVRECTGYYEKMAMSLKEMEEMAHVLVLGKGHKIGFGGSEAKFVSPEEYEKMREDGKVNDVPLWIRTME